MSLRQHTEPSHSLYRMCGIDSKALGPNFDPRNIEISGIVALTKFRHLSIELFYHCVVGKRAYKATANRSYSDITGTIDLTNYSGMLTNWELWVFGPYFPADDKSASKTSIVKMIRTIENCTATHRGRYEGSQILPLLLGVRLGR